MALFDKRLQDVIFYCSSQECSPVKNTSKGVPNERKIAPSKNTPTRTDPLSPIAGAFLSQ
jgi:hypothetical protein